MSLSPLWEADHYISNGPEPKDNEEAQGMINAQVKDEENKDESGSSTWQFLLAGVILLMKRYDKGSSNGNRDLCMLLHMHYLFLDTASTNSIILRPHYLAGIHSVKQHLTLGMKLGSTSTNNLGTIKVW